jgi:hypothetical protein
MAQQIGEISSAWADLGPTRPLPSSEQQQRPSAKALEIIGKLGLRYPPANSVDREAHAARVALLAEDCADIPDEWLDEAARRWAKSQPFFPRTCEFREEALSYGRYLEGRKALPAPKREAPPPPKRSLLDRRGEAMTQEESDELNRILAQLGATARYRPDGSRYTIERAA